MHLIISSAEEYRDGYVFFFTIPNTIGYPRSQLLKINTGGGNGIIEKRKFNLPRTFIFIIEILPCNDILRLDHLCISAKISSLSLSYFVRDILGKCVLFWPKYVNSVSGRPKHRGAGAHKGARRGGNAVEACGTSHSEQKGFQPSAPIFGIFVNELSNHCFQCAI